MLLKSSYQVEINRFCDQLLGGDFNIKGVTKGALSQARNKLNPWAFQRLNEVAVNSFYEGALINVWMDFRVLAVDGSRLRLPKSADISKEFGAPGFGPNADSETSVASCSILYDVLNHVTLDAQIGPYKESERSLLDKHFPKLKKGDLLLADRGYPGHDLMIKLMKAGVEFCIRLPDSWWKIAREFKYSTEIDKVVEIELSPQASMKNEGQKRFTCRLIKVALENGNTEILCTSLLDQQKYEYNQFKALYHLRWNVEETYKLLKTRIELEDFSGRTSLSVKQDFHAKIFMMTLCATLCHPIENKIREEFRKEKTGNQYDQKLNRSYALGTTKSKLLNLFFRKNIGKLLKLLDAMIHRVRELIRPGRHHKRNRKSKRAKIYSTNYKSI